MSTERRKAATINDIYRILGPDALLAYTDSVHDVVAFGSTCRESKQMFLNHKSLFSVFNTNLGILIRQFGFTSIKQLRAFLADSRACISGSFLLRAIGVKVTSAYIDKPTDMDLFVYCRGFWMRQLAVMLAETQAIPDTHTEFHAVNNCLNGLGYTRTEFSDTTYRGSVNDIVVLKYSRSDTVSGGVSIIEVIFVSKSTSSHISGFDIDICGSRLGTVSKNVIGSDGSTQIIFEDVVDFPNIKEILKREAHVQQNRNNLLKLFPNIWRYDFLYQESEHGPYREARELLFRIYKYYSRGFSFPEICLPPVWDGDCAPDSWKPLVHSPPSAGFVFKSSMSELTDDKIYKTV